MNERQRYALTHPLNRVGDDTAPYRSQGSTPPACYSSRSWRWTVERASTMGGRSGTSPCPSGIRAPSGGWIRRSSPNARPYGS